MQLHIVVRKAKGLSQVLSITHGLGSTGSHALPLQLRLSISGVCVFLIKKNLFWLHCMTFKIFVLQPGIKPVASAVKAQGSNHLTSREVPLHF